MGFKITDISNAFAGTEEHSGTMLLSLIDLPTEEKDDTQSADDSNSKDRK
jgi:hypothetical protein